MKAPAVALYARCSTILKQDPEHQLVPVREFAKQRGFSIYNEYIDRASGTKEHRKSLDEMIAEARRGKFKHIVIYALDRLSRDTRHTLNLLHELSEYGVTIISLRESLDFSSAVGRAFLSIMSVVSALERDLLAERIKTALAVKKLQAEAKGQRFKIGRPKTPPDKVNLILRLRDEGHSIRKVAEKSGIAKSTVEKILKVSRKTSKKPSS